jgi:hypothetical protein
MGFLSHLKSRAPSRLTRLPSGSFTIDSEGEVISYTLPHSFPEAYMRDIGRMVIGYFRGAQEAQVRVKVLIVNYPALKLSARELQGGAIVFLAPQALPRT